MATTADDVWRILGELAEAQKETEALLKHQAQESDRRFQESAYLLKQQARETQHLLKQQAQESERRRQETDRQIRQVNRQIGDLGNRLGEFVEWQVRPAAIRLFQSRGIAVQELASDVTIQRDGEGLEIDLLAINTTVAVLIEVKSKLSQSDVDDHLERLGKFKRLMPRYQDVQAMGAIAAMVVPPDIARYAYRQGLFVIAQTGDDMAILNDANFSPKIW
jgi:hypothetical protein